MLLQDHILICHLDIGCEELNTKCTELKLIRDIDDVNQLKSLIAKSKDENNVKDKQVTTYKL